jgi:hypothetical protein
VPDIKTQQCFYEMSGFVITKSQLALKNCTRYSECHTQKRQQYLKRVKLHQPDLYGHKLAKRPYFLEFGPHRRQSWGIGGVAIPPDFGVGGRGREGREGRGGMGTQDPPSFQTRLTPLLVRTMNHNPKRLHVRTHQFCTNLGTTSPLVISV